MLRTFRTLLSATALAGALLVPLGAQGSVLAAGPAPVSFPEPDPDEVIPPAQLSWLLDDTYLMLEQLEREIERGAVSDPDEAFQVRIDDLWERTDDLAGAGAVTWGELFELDDATFRLVDDMGVDPFSLPMPGPGGAETAEEPVITAAPKISDAPAVTAAARESAVAVYHEAAALLALGAFDGAAPGLIQLTEIVGRTGVADGAATPAMITSLTKADTAGATHLDLLAGLEPAASDTVLTAVGALPADEMTAVEAGGTVAMTANEYVVAIESLLHRNGRPLPNGSQVPELDVVAADLAAAIDSVDGGVPSGDAETTTTEPTTTVATTEPATNATTPATAPLTTEPVADDVLDVELIEAPADTGSDLAWLLVAIGGVVAALALAVVLVVLRRRRNRYAIPGSPGFHDLLDVSRRLAGCSTSEEVEELAIRQAVRLTGAAAGGYLRHRNRRLSVGYVTEHDMFVADRLNEGVLDRVVGAGQDLLQISRTEPAIRNLPVSLLATPVFARGVVAGAIVLFRDAEDPFTQREHGLLTDLKPIVGGALESVSATEQARHDALTDGLTEVGNRRALDLFLGECRGCQFAVAMIDLDHFKAVNDGFGHQGGDDLLRAVAQRISDTLRPVDTLYRYGGEEFALVMTDTAEADAAAIAERVRVAISARPFALGTAEEHHFATASIGVAAGTDGDAVVRRADDALYQAKENGRDRVERAAPTTGV